MRIQPDSTVTLYGGVDIDNGEQLVFSSKNNQTAYFNSKIVRQTVNCTTVKKTGALRLEVSGAVVSTCNYLSFINPSFDNKIIYARIIDYDYINNECVEIDYAIDYWQTWMFDVDFNDMYIEREHLSEASHDLAEANPYNPNIPEFWTAESLPMTHDLEKENYSIGDDDSYDGYFVGKAAVDEYGVDEKIGVLLYLADIDFEDLDTGTSGTNRKSYKFVQDILSIVSGEFSYVNLSNGMHEYLHTNYPTDIPNWTMEGSGWTNIGLDPYSGSRIHPCYTTIFIQSGGSSEPVLPGYVPGWQAFETLLNDLTTWGAKDQIINMFAMPNNLFVLSAVRTSGQYVGSVQAAMTVPTTNVWSKKLLRFPYSFIRLIAPNGDKKELQYEYFQTAQRGDGVCYVDVLLDVIEKPTMIIAPDNYRMTGLSPHHLVDDSANLDEGLLFKQFPTMPYNIDTFLSQMASVSLDIIGNMTALHAADLSEQDALTNLNYRDYSWLGNTLGSIGGVVSSLTSGDISGAISGIGNAFSIGTNTYEAGVKMTTDRRKYNIEAGLWNEAYKALGGGRDNEVYQSIGKLRRPAYACDEYHMSNGDGMINYSELLYQDVIMLRVQLNNRVLNIYDTWFKNYGYSSGRCGIPRVILYSRGASSTDELPEWVTLNGKQTTYIKTSDCKVTHSMLPVATYIKQMFDSGVRMIKGDLT